MKELSYIVLCAAFLFLMACQANRQPAAVAKQYSQVEGETMGTYYRITYSDTLDIQAEADSILFWLNQELSTYIEDSKISLFNAGNDSLMLDQGMFLDNYLISKELFEKSGGYYDPSVMPLVNYWGFGYSGKKEVEKIDSVAIQSMMEYVGLENLQEIKNEKGLILVKKHPRFELDFSSVAKGYAVDMLANYLDALGVKDYLVDIGGEMYLKGENPKGKHWSIGINTPSEKASLSDAFRYLRVSEKALATSGNYRNYYEKNGIKVSHTINPLSGFPERSNLLSVSIIANNCAMADAWATTCMVMGIEKAEKLLLEEKDIDACFIYVENDELKSKYINNFESYIAE